MTDVPVFGGSEASDEYDSFVAALPVAWEHDLQSRNVTTAYWQARRRAGHSAEMLREASAFAASRGLGVGGIVTSLRTHSGTDGRKPIKRATVRTHGGRALPLPECKECGQPYRRDFTPGGLCVGCGNQLQAGTVVSDGKVEVNSTMSRQARALLDDLRQGFESKHTQPTAPPTPTEDDPW